MLFVNSSLSYVSLGVTSKIKDLKTRNRLRDFILTSKFGNCRRGDNAD